MSIAIGSAEPRGTVTRIGVSGNTRQTLLTQDLTVHRPLSNDDLPTQSRLNRLCGPRYFFPQIDSTNAFLLQSAATLPDGVIASAEFQDAGRGRLGRNWLAQRGSSILLSILLQEPPSSPLLAVSAMLASLAACQAIEARTDLQPSVRWPNDLVIHDRKIAGVLAESTPLAENRRALVIGVGINCLQQRGHFDNELSSKATSLEIESTLPIDRAAIACELVLQLDAHFAASSSPIALAAARKEWLARCNDRGKPVRLLTRNGPRSGTILDIDVEAGLLVQLDTGERCLFEAATTSRLWEPA